MTTVSNSERLQAQFTSFSFVTPFPMIRFYKRNKHNNFIFGTQRSTSSKG